MSDDRAGEPVAAELPWRRLDARMLLVHPVNEVLRFLPALVGVFLIGRSLDEGGWWHFAAVAAPIALGLLRYATTTFRIGRDVVELRRGLINRRTLTARLDRVRTVDLTSSPIHRMLGLARVEIGTGSTGREGADRLRLDALALPQARALRVALLPASQAVSADARAAGQLQVAGPPRVLLRLDPRWVRYAPLTTSGLVVAAAVAGASSQFVRPMLDRWQAWQWLGPRVLAWPTWALVAAAVVACLLVISVLALFGYLLNYWGFTLSRDADGRRIHVRRGLLTTREISLETARVRGLEWHEPLGLRLVGAARLAVIVTGVSRREADVATVTPPAPRAVTGSIAAALFHGADALSVPLVGHGRRATTRRFTRALVVAALVAGGWALLVLARHWDLWLLSIAALPIVAAIGLAADRARRLGHALTREHLVMRAHSLRGRRDALTRAGIIGWTFRQSLFQRRAGLVTLTATTAAGKQGYRVYDVPDGDAVALADQAVPGLLTPFLTERVYRVPQAGAPG